VTQSDGFFQARYLEFQVSGPKLPDIHMRTTLVLVLGCFFAPVVGAQVPADSTTEELQAVRIPISFSVQSMGKSTWGIKLRVAGTFTVRNLQSLSDLDLGGFRTTAFLAGVELLIPLSRYKTLRPFADIGVGKDEQTDETVFLVEAGALAELIFPWREFFFSVEPAFRVNGKSGNELGATDDRVQGLLHVEARHSIPVTIARQRMYGGIYAETGYFLNSLDFLSVGGSPTDAQSAYEVGLTLGFFDIRPKIWFIRIPRISVGYRFRGDVTGIRIRIGGDWATKMFQPGAPGS